MENNVVHIYQRPEDFQAGVEQVGLAGAACQLMEEYHGMMEHGTLTDVEAIQVLTRIQLVADGIY